MTLIDFARGPAMQGSALILIVGLFWRLTAILLLARRPQLAKSRASLHGRIVGGLRLIVTRSIPRRTFRGRMGVSMSIGYGFHLGLLAILIGGAPHILVLHQLTGFMWPNLPKGVIVVISGLTLTLLIVLLVRRIVNPVTRLLSTPDDYFSWCVVFLPVFTGILLSGETIGSYESLLALHILSFEAMIVWLPFGKLAHAVLVFAGRGVMGANFARKGAAT